MSEETTELGHKAMKARLGWAFSEEPTSGTVFGPVSPEDTRKMKPTCIIPARKNSKRLKNKNKLLLNGKSLVLYAIEAARESKVFSRIIVTSDDMEILELAYRMRILPHKRPWRLAGDEVELKEVCAQLLGLLYTTLTEEFAMLSPANPFRTAEDIRNCYKLLMGSDANTVMSVVKFDHCPQGALMKKGKYVTPYWGNEYIKNSQQLKQLYRGDGSIVFCKTRPFLENFKVGFYGKKVLPYFMERSIDIDTKEDFEHAEFLMKNGK
ncbi:MAG: acylneuraminate cytidylyltransferase family protein [Candidatus Bathyarchaeota archaeon]|nr:acylneuraminate cytidylyltransferase family protein [Candidatus Bathyarchaeota archaeon]